MFIFEERTEIALGLNQLPCTQALSFEWREEQFARELSSEWRSARIRSIAYNHTLCAAYILITYLLAY